MTLQSFKNRVKGPALAAGLGAAMFGAFSTAANANDSCGNCHVESGYETSVLNAGIESRNYAKRNDAIGILIYYGAFEGAPSPEDIGDKFVEEIAKRGEQAKYFIVQAEKPGVSMSFHFPFTGTEPMTVHEAARTLNDVIDQKQRLSGYVAEAPSVGQ